MKDYSKVPIGERKKDINKYLDEHCPNPLVRKLYNANGMLHHYRLGEIYYGPNPDKDLRTIRRLRCIDMRPLAEACGPLQNKEVLFQDMLTRDTFWVSAITSTWGLYFETEEAASKYLMWYCKFYYEGLAQSEKEAEHKKELMNAVTKPLTKRIRFGIRKLWKKLTTSE